MKWQGSYFEILFDRDHKMRRGLTVTLSSDSPSLIGLFAPTFVTPI